GHKSASAKSCWRSMTAQRSAVHIRPSAWLLSLQRRLIDQREDPFGKGGSPDCETRFVHELTIHGDRSSSPRSLCTGPAASADSIDTHRFRTALPEQRHL